MQCHSWQNPLLTANTCYVPTPPQSRSQEARNNWEAALDAKDRAIAQLEDALQARQRAIEQLMREKATAQQQALAAGSGMSAEDAARYQRKVGVKRRHLH